MNQLITFVAIVVAATMLVPAKKANPNLLGVQHLMYDSLGEALFTENCMVCHKTGNKLPKAPALSNMRQHTPGQVIRIITRKELIIDPIREEAVMHPKNFDGKLSPENLSATAQYVSDMAGQ